MNLNTSESETLSLRGRLLLATPTLCDGIFDHSAWSPGQMEDEIERNTWITLDPPQNLLSQPHDLSLWKRLLSGISPYHALISQAPKNPMLN